MLSWTPEGRAGDETVAFVLGEVTPTSVVRCACITPDVQGTLTVPVALLSQHFVPTTGPTHATASVSVSRWIDAPAAGDGLVVHLVGVVTVDGAVLLQ